MVGRSSQVARGLNTIAANITQNQDALAAYGISVEDANGTLKSTFDVLSELKPKWDEMSDSERVALGVTLAGKNQYKVLASVMSNFATATEATTAAINSSGSAAKENAKYMESIESRISAVNAAFQKMSTKVVDSDLVKGILDIVKAMAEFGGTDFGTAVTQFVLLSGLSWGGLSLLGQSILPSIMTSFGATEATIIGFKAALSTSLPVIMAITAAIVGLVAVTKAIKEAYDAANPSIEQASLSMKNAQEASKEAKDNYVKAKEKLDELNATPFEDRTSEIQNEIDRLRALVRYYEAVKNFRSEEAVANAAVYAKTVENQGISSGWEVSMPVKTGRKTTEGIDEVRQYTRVFQTYEAAVLSAAAASAQFNNQIVDIDNIENAGKELTMLGVSFTEVTDTVPQIINHFNDLLVSFEENGDMSAKLRDEYNDLVASSVQYAEALQIMKDNGIELTSEQEEFLSVFNNVTEAYNEYIESQALSQGLTKEEIESRYEAASALSAYAQELINAANAYQIFKDMLEASGDYDDSFKGFSSILNEVISEFDAGQVGSQTFLTGLELLTGQTFTSAEAVEYMNTHLNTLRTLFGDSESGGMGLLTVLENLGYATLDTDGNLQVSIDDFVKLANQLGISEGALYSLTEALRIMGVDFQYNVEDILSNIEGLGDGITSVKDGITHIDFDTFVDQAQKLGLTNEEILIYKNLLQEAANTKLDNVEAGMEKLKTPTENATSNVEDLGGALDGLGDFDSSGVVSSLNAIGDAASGASGKVSDLDGALDGLGGIENNADGTKYAKAGASLVNEEGPELIQSGDEAYIAGNGLPTVTHLNEGDRVYTAEETKNILGGKLLKDSIQAHRLGIGNIAETTFGNSGKSGNISKSTIGISSAITTVLADTLKNLKPDNGSVVNTNNSSSSNKDYKAEFDEWLKAKKHALEMDEISEKEYYESLEEMNEKYFKNSEEYQDEYWKYQEQIYKWRKKEEENAASEKEKADEEAAKNAQKLAEEEAKAYKGSFDDWLSSKKHQLAMDEITEEAYYAALKVMNDKYFKGKEEYQSEYQKYQEQIYSWEKKQAEQAAKDAEQAAKEKANAEQKASEDAIKAHKEEFDNWLEGKKHQLAMDEISEEDYYEALRGMNDKYFKDREEYQKEYQKYQEQIYSWDKKQEEERIKLEEQAIKESEQAAAAAAKAYEDEFNNWLKNKKHSLAMDEITEEEYYKSLQEMNNRYFKDKEEYQDEYQKYQEQIYSWQKKQEEELAKQLQQLAEAQEKAYKDEFDSWLSSQQHALNMDFITQEEYYSSLGEMNDKYFKDKEKYQKEYWKYQEQIYSWEKKQQEELVKAEEQAIKDAEEAAQEVLKAHKEEFNNWLKEEEHALAMDLITQEEYYEALEKMSEQYFKDREEYQDEYWKYEEKIYSWKKKQAEEEAKSQEEALKDRIELEKKLNNLAVAKASKVKVYQNGQFRYVSDREALAKAQADLSSYGNGTLSAVGGISLVGENGPEMRVLNKGDGILSAGITKNLLSWGLISPNDLKKNTSETYNFDINNLSLPDVQNPIDFVSGLKAFALQYTTQRGS